MEQIKFKRPNIKVIIILIILKIMYDLFFAFMDFTNAITEKTGYTGDMLNIPNIKAGLEIVLSNIE